MYQGLKSPWPTWSFPTMKEKTISILRLFQVLKWILFSVFKQQHEALVKLKTKINWLIYSSENYELFSRLPRRGPHTCLETRGGDTEGHLPLRAVQWSYGHINKAVGLHFIKCLGLCAWEWALVLHTPSAVCPHPHVHRKLLPESCYFLLRNLICLVYIELLLYIGV